MKIFTTTLLFALLSSSGYGLDEGKIGEQWDHFVSERFSTQRDQESYRRYDQTAPDHVKEFYLKNHSHQTLKFVLDKKEQYLPLRREKMGIWEVLEKLDALVDESDPDLDLPQSYHFFQTAEALRRDGMPRWLILTGFIHDMGKVLTTYGEPQWAVVGDTFPVGCRFSEKVVLSEYFSTNPDSQNSRLQTPCGIYREGIGLDNLHMSWGHDEYVYQVMLPYLPPEALFILRYHSFYAMHREGAYQHLLSDVDRKMMIWAKLFSQYDLYSKSQEKLNIDALRPYYEDLVAEFLPPKIQW